MLAILTGFFQRNMLMIMGWAAAIGAVAMVLLGAKNAGRNAERVDQMKAAFKQTEQANEIRRNTDRLPSAAVHDELRNKWTRD